MLVANGPGRGLLRARHPRQGDAPRAGRARARVRGRRAVDPAPLPDRRPAAAGAGVRAASAAARSISGGLLALAHGTNDAQKTMGVITLALVANGNICRPTTSTSPTWVVVSAGDGDRARHLRRRLADHQDDGQPHPQDGLGPGLRGAGRGRGGDPGLHPRAASRSRRRTRSPAP